MSNFTNPPTPDTPKNHSYVKHTDNVVNTPDTAAPKFTPDDSENVMQDISEFERGKPAPEPMSVEQSLIDFGSRVYASAIEMKGFDDKSPLVKEAATSFDALLTEARRQGGVDELEKMREPFKNAMVIYESRFTEYRKDRIAELKKEASN